MGELANYSRTGRRVDGIVREMLALVDMMKDQGDRMVCFQQGLADFIALSCVQTEAMLAALEARGTVRRGYRQIDILKPTDFG